MNSHLYFIFLLFFLGVSCSKSDTGTETDDGIIRSARYFDATGGDDLEDGKSPESAWKSIDSINSITWGPGSSILLKSGERWTANLSLKGSGSSEQPIRFSSYGEGVPPVIQGGGNTYAIKLYNQQYWEISKLEITNFSEKEEGMTMEEWETNNMIYWAEEKNLPQYTETRHLKYGIYVQASDFGAVNHLHFSNLEIHGINGDISSKDNGGIFLKISGSFKPTWFNDLLIEDCYIHDVDRTGISNQSDWSTRSYEVNTNWKPSEKVVIRSNTFERTGANALIVRVSSNPLMEYNLFDHCAIKESGNASFSFNCDNALWQYNEARFTKYNVDDADAGGFDSDYRCKNTVFQYNYSHQNEYGGILVCCQGGDTRFNVGTIVRYNLFVNNDGHVFRVSGTPENTLIHNNVIYNGDDESDLDFIWHKNWGGYPNLTAYANNIFHSGMASAKLDLGSSTGNSFMNNIFYGSFSGDLPEEQYTFDPLFQGEDLSGLLVPEMFKIEVGSLAIDAGIEISGAPEKDFFGNTITDKANPDIGIHEQKLKK